MNEFINIKEEVKQYYSARASLAALGLKTRQQKLFKPITRQVKIAQKKVKYSPTEKLMDGFIAILAGAHGLVEINKRVRPDRGLQIAFGRSGCAEQSVVQDTLDACTEQNVAQMHEAMALIYRQHSQGYHHHYDHQWQLLDIDMTGRPSGKKAAFASKGYFAKQRNRRGRQVGYVVATHYEEIVVERLFDGKTQLPTALRSLVKAAAQTLALNKQKRHQTILRIDSGGGSVDDVNWALAQGYQLHCKDYSGTRAKTLADSVTKWLTDPADPDRQMGWGTAEPDIYCRPVKRIAVRCRKHNGQGGVGVILSTLSVQEVLGLTQQSGKQVQNPSALLLAYVHFYDQRGGGVEIEIKEDKQGLGTSKRNKKRFEAQQMVIQLEALAHNTLTWARCWLTPHWPTIARFGMLRLVRDVFHINGLILFDHKSQGFQIILNRADPLARKLCSGFAALLAQEQLAVTLGET
jgi:hypothetical protein